VTPRKKKNARHLFAKKGKIFCSADQIYLGQMSIRSPGKSRQHPLSERLVVDGHIIKLNDCDFRARAGTLGD
jgi:hypothetical protein